MKVQKKQQRTYSQQYLSINNIININCLKKKNKNKKKKNGLGDPDEIDT